MLTIREEQLMVFEQAALGQFRDRMAIYGRELAPELYSILEKEPFRAALEQAIDRAGHYGFTNRGPIRIYVELTLFCGSDFDTDPLYSSIGKILMSDASQMMRAELMHQEYARYLDKVCGPDNINVHNSWSRLLGLARRQDMYSSDGLKPNIVQELSQVFPERADYVGEESLLALIHEARAEARALGSSASHAVDALSRLKFVFGHGCARDPFYPWISRTLLDARVADSAARTARIERKMFTWLEHALTRPRQTVET